MSIERADPKAPAWRDTGAEHLARYLFAADWAGDKHVLDVGTGAGYGVAVLRTAGARSIQAIDADPVALSEAARVYGGPGAVFLSGNAESLDGIKRPVDLICSFENIEHLADPGAFVRAAARVLEPDGVLLCSSPDRTATPPFVGGRPANPFHLHEWYREEFLSLLAIGFENVDLRTQVRTHAFESRMTAALALEEHLAYLWDSPSLRLGRLFARLTGRPRLWRPTAGLAAPGIGDYPIVASGVAELLGRPYCHVAVCRGPRSLP